MMFSRIFQNLTLPFQPHPQDIGQSNVNSVLGGSAQNIRTPKNGSNISLNRLEPYESSIIKIQRAYRDYRAQLAEVIPEKAVGSTDDLRSHVIRTAKSQIGHHYWSNFYPVFLSVHNEIVHLPFNALMEDEIQSYFDQPHAQKNMENTVPIRELIQNWPAPEKKFVISDIKKCYSQIAANQNMELSPEKISKMDVTIDLGKFKTSSKGKVMRKLTPNPLIALKYAPPSQHLALLSRLKHDNDLAINCLQFVHHVLFQAGVTDLHFLKNENTELIADNQKVPLLQMKEKAKPGDLLVTYDKNSTTFMHVSLIDCHHDDNTFSVIELGFNSVTPHVRQNTMSITPERSYYIVSLDKVRALCQ